MALSGVPSPFVREHPTIGKETKQNKQSKPHPLLCCRGTVCCLGYQHILAAVSRAGLLRGKELGDFVSGCAALSINNGPLVRNWNIWDLV